MPEAAGRRDAVGNRGHRPQIQGAWGNSVTADAAGRRAFRDERQWADNEPLRHTDDIAGVPLGVWCGTDDPFVDAARELVDRTDPVVVAIGPGTCA